MTDAGEMDTWSETLAAVSRLRDETDLTLFHACEGAEYDGGLLVVGRSVNGWIPEFSSRDLVDESTRRSLVEDEQRRLDQRCPMRWVTDRWGARKGYNTARSAFWRVNRRVALGLELGTEKSWASSLAWTNLYKVSPHDHGNPSAALMRAQLDGCRGLLQGDIARAKPSRILFLTGLWWLDPFRKALGLGLEYVGADGVEAFGRSGTARVVVAKHPQGKPEVPMVERILDLFGSADGQ